MEKVIGLACDHAGYALKQFVKQYLDEKHLPYKDYGTYNEESCDYPDFAHALAHGMEVGEVESGIAICGSGEGISMTLNKHPMVRAALVWIPEIAHLTRQHNDANVLSREVYPLARRTCQRNGDVCDFLKRSKAFAEGTSPTNGFVGRRCKLRRRKRYCRYRQHRVP